MRRTGQTLAMVQRLPSSAAVLIVHTGAMRRYVERMIHEVRGHEVARAVRVVVTANERDALREFAGRAIPVFIDHAVPGNVSGYTDELSCSIARGRNIVAMIDATRPASSEVRPG